MVVTYILNRVGGGILVFIIRCFIVKKGETGELSLTGLPPLRLLEKLVQGVLFIEQGSSYMRHGCDCGWSRARIGGFKTTSGARYLDGSPEWKDSKEEHEASRSDYHPIVPLRWGS